MIRSLFSRTCAGVAAMVAALLPTMAPASFLYWVRPDFSGAPVIGDEPGLTLPLANAKPAEISANLLWAMRAGLNVAALQCQFAPGLMTVHYYNDILKSHTAELESARLALTGYFKRINKKTWQTDFDQYTTRVYNGFAPFNAQLGFCETAAAIDRDAMKRPRGALIETARTRMRELRNSLVPVGEAGLRFDQANVMGLTFPPADMNCYDKKDRVIDCTTGKRIKLPKA